MSSKIFVLGRLLAVVTAILVAAPAVGEVRHGTVFQVTGNTVYVNLGIPDGLEQGQPCVVRDRSGKELGACRVGTVYMSRCSVVVLTEGLTMEIGYEVDVSIEVEAAEEAVSGMRRSAHKEAQRKTLEDVERVGAAMFHWVTDQLSAEAAADSSGALYRVADFPQIGYRALDRLLVPRYLGSLPRRDGWNNEYDYRLNTDDPLAPAVMLIRSPGYGAAYEADEYASSVFEPDDWQGDIVWADGRWVRKPNLTAEAISAPQPLPQRLRAAP